MLSNSVVHHFNLSSLFARSDVDRCYICLMVAEQLNRRYPKAEADISNWELFRTEVSWSRDARFGEKARLYFVLTQPLEPRDMFNYGHIFKMELWPVDAFRRHFVPTLEMLNLPASDCGSTA